MGFDVKGKDNKENQSSNFTIKEGKTPKKHKKGLHGFPKFCVIFFSLLIGIPALLVGVVYACFYDAGHTEVPYQENFQKEELINNILVDSMDHAACEEHEVKLELKEYDINSLLHSVLEKDATLKQFVPNLYVDTSAANVSMVLEANALNIFRTRLFVYMHYVRGEINGEDSLIFNITNIKLGRIDGMEKLINPISGMFGLPDLSKIFADAGFRIKVDLNNLRMYYKVKDFSEDILAKVDGQTSDFLTLVKEILTSDKFENTRYIDGPQNGSLFTFGMHLDDVKVTSETHGVNGYVVPDGYFSTQLTTIVTEIKRLLNEGIIDKEHANTTEVDLIAKYMMGGDILIPGPDNEILRLQDLGAFNNITIPQYNYNLDNQYKLQNVILNKIPSTITGPLTVKVTADEINKSLTTVASTGVIASFLRNMGTDEDPDYKLNYVCSDRIGVLINNDTLYLIINMNVNGYDTQLTLICPKKSGVSSFGRMEFTMGQFKFGDVEVSEEVKEKYKNVITQALTGEGFDGVISTVGNDIIVDVSSTLASKSINPTNCNVDMSLESYQSASNPGGITLTVTPKI